MGTVQNRGHMKMTHAGDLGPPEADAVFIILYTISVSNCDAYCLLQTVKFVQTYKYNFHITVTILLVES